MSAKSGRRQTVDYPHYEMNKLQLYIYKSLRGFKAVRNINPAENIQRHIRDMRRALEILDYDPAEKYLFYLINYIDEGSFFTILRTIPTQPFDHLATTIFVPNGLKITVEEFAEIVHRTTRMVSNPAVTAEDLTDLHALFAKEYPVDADAPSTVASMGRKFAFCNYGGDTGTRLDDFFGPNMYRTDYLQYEGVVLVDAELGVNSTADDVTALGQVQNVALLPPEPDAGGFQPYIFHHQFNRPYLVGLGSNITVTWRRPGFEDRLQEITVDREDMQVPPTTTDDSRKAITPASFYITAHGSRTRVANATIVVNGIEINEAHSFTLAELKNADVDVSAPGYSPFHTTCDLAATAQALIQLPEMRRVYTFELPVKSSDLGAPIRFEIHTKRTIDDSPIEGYELNATVQEGATRVNHLLYTGSSSIATSRNLVIAAVGALIVGFLLGWMLTGSSPDAKPETDTLAVESPAEALATPAPSQQTQTPVATPAPAKAAPAAAAPTKTADADAIAYLDANKMWNRADLEKYPSLKGLFDDLNSFNYDNITKVWGPKLKASKNFAKVATAVENGARKKKFVPASGQKYCDKDDSIINYVNYTYKVDP